MAFLNKEKLAKRKSLVGVKDHPLLGETTLSESEKSAYVEGLVFTTLMDDEKVDAAEREAVESLARSLRLDEAELKACFDTVQALKTDEEKMSFVEEIVGVLKRDTIPLRFVADVESLITKDGAVPPDAAEGLDYIATLLFETTDWRAARAERLDVMEKTAKVKAAADLKTVVEALEAHIESLTKDEGGKKDVTSEDLASLAAFWKNEDLPNVPMNALYLYAAGFRVKEITSEVVTDSNLFTFSSLIGSSAPWIDLKGCETDKDKKRTAAKRVIAGTSKKRTKKAWFLFALILRKYDVAAVATVKLTPLLRQAQSQAAGSTEKFDTQFTALAQEYLGLGGEAAVPSSEK